MSEQERKRIIRRANERGDFVVGDDGFWIYWPTPLEGALSEWVLRLLADELELRNAPWAAQIERDLAASNPIAEESER